MRGRGHDLQPHYLRVIIVTIFNPMLISSAIGTLERVLVSGAAIIGKWAFIHNTKTWTANMGLHNLTQVNSQSKREYLRYTSPKKDNHYVTGRLVFGILPITAKTNATISVTGIPSNEGASTASFNSVGQATFNFTGIQLTNGVVDIPMGVSIRYTTTCTVAAQPTLAFIFSITDGDETVSYEYPAVSI